jgi:hypothetical protein
MGLENKNYDYFFRKKEMEEKILKEKVAEMKKLEKKM